MDYKHRYIDHENERLEAIDSPWRLGFSSADSSTLCLLAHEKSEH